MHDRRTDNRFLFHWMKPEKLTAFASKGVLRPSWTHWIRGEDRMVRGTSTCKEPMLWNPDDEKPGEPCVILDREVFEFRSHLIDSGSTYHLTRKIKEAARAGRDIAAILELDRQQQSRTFSQPDEVFITDAIPWAAVAAIGCELEREGQATAKVIADLAATHSLPLLDMSGWVVSSPGIDETDDEVLRHICAPVPGQSSR